MSLELKGVVKDYPLPRRATALGRRVYLRALSGINLTILEGETVALIGESGCGKSTAARILLGLEDPTAGATLFDNAPLRGLSGMERRRYRHSVQAVFQNPYASLSPRMRIGEIVAEPLLTGLGQGAGNARERVREVIEEVGLSEASLRLYPHEFSGGQRQRIAIARALATKPRFLILDEPVSALDVSIRAQIINLLKRLRVEHNIGQLMISHDLGTAIYLSRRIVVLYAGRVVEEIAADRAVAHAVHPYTRALLKAAEPQNFRGRIEALTLPGEVPDPADLPRGCAFHPRCPLASERCKREVPVKTQLNADHSVWCWEHERARADGTVPIGPVPVGCPQFPSRAPRSPPKPCDGSPIDD